VALPAATQFHSIAFSTNFQFGDDLIFTFGPLVRQDDMLALWPSVYPQDGILQYFAYSGAPGAYNLNLGAGAGLLV